MMVLGLFAVTCGGSVVEREGEGGTSGDAGAGGTPNTGGSVSKGGSGPGGSVGTGGWNTGGGTAGAAAYGGGVSKGGSAPAAGGTGVTCPPLPSCNWCNGQAVLDSWGCTVGWICANGVDPCTTQHCKNQECAPGQFCGADGLCWNTNTSCSPKTCYGADSYCECSWNCGANAYSTKCKVTASSIDCGCFENGVSNMSCGGSAPGGNFACQNSCCGFPEFEP